MIATLVSGDVEAGLAQTAVQQLDDIRRRLEAAENAGDADSIVQMMKEDCVLMVPDFPIQEGKDACAAFVRDITAFQREHFDRHITYVSAEIRLVGTVAFDRGTFSFTVTSKASGEVSDAHGKYLYLYSHAADGAWTLSLVIVTLDGEKEEEAPE